MIKRSVWLVLIEMPKELMNEIREGSIDLAGQTVDLQELDDSYDDDLDQGDLKDQTDDEAEVQQPGMAGNTEPIETT
jgi:hypothetical protein